MIRYKIDVLPALKAAGYSTYRIRQDKILSESVLQNIRNGTPIDWQTLDILCRILDCQPGHILEYIESPDNPELTPSAE